MSLAPTSPPHDLAAEESVLGAILIDNDALNGVVEILSGDDFYRDAHRRIYRAMVDLADHNQPIDAITLTDALRRLGALEEVGGPGAIAELAARVPTAANIEHYAAIVKRAAQLRSARETGQWLIDESQKGADPGLLAAEAARRLDTVARGERSAIDPTAGAWPVPDAAALYGLAGEFVRIVGPQSEADPIALLVQFLVAAGNVAGRSAHRVADGARHHLNLFVVLCGQTGKGRKGSSYAWVSRFFSLVDRQWATDRIASGLSSGEGLIWAVRDAIIKRESVRERGRVTDYENVEVDPGIADKRLLVVEGEFAAVLKVLTREGSTLSTTIRDAWDRGDLRTLTKNSPARATGAHISVIGHVTIEELTRNLSDTEAANGFANRFLWVATRRSKLLPNGGDLADSDLLPLAQRVKDALSALTPGCTFRFDADCAALWEQSYASLSAGRPGLLGCMLGRAEAQTLRLACLYAALDGSLTVGVNHLTAALALWRYCERSAEAIFGKRLGDPDADLILSALRAAPHGLRRSEVSGLFARNVSATRIERALTALRTGGLAQVAISAGRGRPAEVWTATHTQIPHPESRNGTTPAPFGNVDHPEEF